MSESQYSEDLGKHYRTRITSEALHGFSVGKAGGHWLAYISINESGSDCGARLKRMHFDRAPPKLKGVDPKEIKIVSHGQMQFVDGGVTLINCVPPGTRATIKHLNRALKELNLRPVKAHRDVPATPDGDLSDDESDEDVDSDDGPAEAGPSVPDVAGPSDPKVGALKQRMSSFLNDALDRVGLYDGHLAALPAPLVSQIETGLKTRSLARVEEIISQGICLKVYQIQKETLHSGEAQHWLLRLAGVGDRGYVTASEGIKTPPEEGVTLLQLAQAGRIREISSQQWEEACATADLEGLVEFATTLADVHPPKTQRDLDCLENLHVVARHFDRRWLEEESKGEDVPFDLRRRMVESLTPVGTHGDGLLVIGRFGESLAASPGELDRCTIDENLRLLAALARKPDHKACSIGASMIVPNLQLKQRALRTDDGSDEKKDSTRSAAAILLGLSDFHAAYINSYKLALAGMLQRENALGVLDNTTLARFCDKEMSLQFVSEETEDEQRRQHQDMISFQERAKDVLRARMELLESNDLAEAKDLMPFAALWTNSDVLAFFLANTNKFPLKELVLFQPERAHIILPLLMHQESIDEAIYAELSDIRAPEFRCRFYELTDRNLKSLSREAPTQFTRSQSESHPHVVNFMRNYKDTTDELLADRHRQTRAALCDQAVFQIKNGSFEVGSSWTAGKLALLHADLRRLPSGNDQALAAIDLALRQRGLTAEDRVEAKHDEIIDYLILGLERRSLEELPSDPLSCGRAAADRINSPYVLGLIGDMPLRDLGQQLLPPAWRARRRDVRPPSSSSSDASDLPDSSEV